MKFGVRVDGVMVVAVGLLAAGYYVYTKRADLLAAVDPTNENNVVNRAVVGSVGQDTVTATADYVFGAIDLLNPFASRQRKRYAAGVYGVKTL